MAILLVGMRSVVGTVGRSIGSAISLVYPAVRRLHDNNALAMGSALSFRTLLALVPALVLAFVVLRAMGVLPESRQSLRSLLETAGFSQVAVAVETTGGDETAATQPQSAPTGLVTAADRIEELAAGVEQKVTLGAVGPVGLVVLIWTAITLLMTLERSLNTIFEAPKSRSLGRSVLLYWSALTLAPLLLLSVNFVLNSAAGKVSHINIMWHIVSFIAWIGPYIVGWFILAALYRLMPNTRISNRTAMIGALVAMPVWMVAKWGFSLYVLKLVVGRASLYGSLGLLPLFLLWMNVSWLVLLFGAQFAYALQDPSRVRRPMGAMKESLGGPHLLAAAVAVAMGYQAARGGASFRQVARRLNMSDQAVHWLLDRLLTAGTLLRTRSTWRSSRYVPARPLDQINLAQLLELGQSPHKAMSPSAAERLPFDSDIREAVERLAKLAQPPLERVTLAQAISTG